MNSCCVDPDYPLLLNLHSHTALWFNPSATDNRKPFLISQARPDTSALCTQRSPFQHLDTELICLLLLTRSLIGGWRVDSSVLSVVRRARNRQVWMLEGKKKTSSYLHQDQGIRLRTHTIAFLDPHSGTWSREKFLSRALENEKNHTKPVPLSLLNFYYFYLWRLEPSKLLDQL